MRSLRAFGLAAGIALAAAGHAAHAQQAPHDPQTQMLPDARGAVPWSLLTRTSIQKVDGRLGPKFPDALRPLHGQTVKLQGYIIPLEPGLKHRRLLLSAWSPSCPFCLTAGPEAMVEVQMRRAVAHSLDAIVLQGRLQLLDNDPAGLFYRLVDAEPAAL
ncbi:Hypothetical protein Rta_24730 [Ramlibacter tataouinensis TTB310]|uniref:DUF3299 domain-containing protein n=1 Tax=Ramlibacter tataouinensis (strain ATCC BAA-407 / DSM 14655 / LMG 21543 / TTB310) TaxID=365046 RepID=F5Y1Y7_RAMTT|nr:Hypothetical protein Rta_24730 [Ramlibacter tataouinensis TTB310]